MSGLDYFSFDEGNAGLSGRITGTASWTTAWAWCEWAHFVQYAIEWTATGAPVGTLALEGNGQLITPGLTPSASGTIPIPAPLGAPGTFGSWPNVAAVAGNASIVIVNPMRWHRLTYTWGSGGDPAPSTGNFSVYRTMRR